MVLFSLVPVLLIIVFLVLFYVSWREAVGGRLFVYGGQAATATSATAAIYRLADHSSISWTTWFALVDITSYTTGVPLLLP